MMQKDKIVLVGLIAAVAIAAAIGINLALAHLPPVGGSSGIADIGGPFVLVDDTGKEVTEVSLAGKPSVIYFGYTFCPEVCPTTLANLSHWIRDLGPDADKLNFVFVTIDPERDTPKVMHEYVASFDKHIRGFTGTPAQIVKIAKEYRVYYKRIPTKDGGYIMDHTAFLYLMNAQGSFVGTIAYQEKDSSALSKLKRLAEAAGS